MTDDAPIPPAIWIAQAVNGMPRAVPYRYPSACCEACARARVLLRVQEAGR